MSAKPIIGEMRSESITDLTCGQAMAWDIGVLAMIACPIPIRRSRLRTKPASVIDRQAKNAAPSMTTAIAAAIRSGLIVKPIPIR